MPCDAPSSPKRGITSIKLYSTFAVGGVESGIANLLGAAAAVRQSARIYAFAIHFPSQLHELLGTYYSTKLSGSAAAAAVTTAESSEEERARPFEFYLFPATKQREKRSSSGVNKYTT